MNEKWFSLSIAEIEKKLKTNAASGITRKAARSAWYRETRQSPDSHKLFIRKHKPVRKIISEIFSDFALIILLLTAVFAILFDDKIIGAVVLVIAAISISLSFFCYFRSQRTMERINLYFLPTAKVIRGGKLYRVSFENIVKGDVIIVEKGDIVCGDARLVTSDNLKVAMRLSRKKYLSLSKQAHGAVLPEENNPAKMVNTIHAGSVIEEGSARAIVYATGMYTYLGAMTGGISDFYSDNIPQELKKLKKICSKISMISMIAILPFSILSLLFSHLDGGTATLSSTFLTALAISASSMSQLACTICKVFFIRRIKDISESKNPAVIRTTDAFDRLSEIDYVFLLDGSAVTDGILHFDTAFTSEGEIKSFTSPTTTMTELFEKVAIYNCAECNALTVGINLPERFKVGLDEFLSKGNADIEALKIRCPIRSYMPGTDTHPTDRIFYTDTNKNMVLDVSRSDEILSQCTHTVISGKIQALTSVGVDKLKHTYNLHRSAGKTVLIFTLSKLENCGNNSGKIFVGAIVLRENVDNNARISISALSQRGIKVISFVDLNLDKNVPQIPIEVNLGIKANKDDFIKTQSPITYRFGEIDTYYGLNESDIEALLTFAHDQGRSVGVVGFSDFAHTVIEKADVFISCAPIINVFSAKTEEELYSLEMAGATSSTSCIQTVKSESDVIIQRPNGTSGGMSSIANIFTLAPTSYRNLNSFFKYLICAQIIMILTVGLPMVLGKPILDARHVLLCSFIIDIFVLLILSDDKTKIPNVSIGRYKLTTLKSHISKNTWLIISVLIASLSAIILPMVLGAIGLFGPYLYKTEYLFYTVLWLHITLTYYIRFGTVFNAKSVIKNKKMLLLFLCVAIFAILTLSIKPLGLLFEIVTIPIAYLIASFVPAIILAITLECAPRSKNTK